MAPSVAARRQSLEGRARHPAERWHRATPRRRRHRGGFAPIRGGRARPGQRRRRSHRRVRHLRKHSARLCRWFALEEPVHRTLSLQRDPRGPGDPKAGSGYGWRHGPCSTRRRSPRAPHLRPARSGHRRRSSSCRACWCRGGQDHRPDLARPRDGGCRGGPLQHPCGHVLSASGTGAQRASVAPWGRGRPIRNLPRDGS